MRERTFIDKEFTPLEGKHTIIIRKNDSFRHYHGKCDLKRVWKYWTSGDGIEAIQMLESRLVPHKSERHE